MFTRQDDHTQFIFSKTFTPALSLGKHIAVATRPVKNTGKKGLEDRQCTVAWSLVNVDKACSGMSQRQRSENETRGPVKVVDEDKWTSGITNTE